MIFSDFKRIENLKRKKAFLIFAQKMYWAQKIKFSRVPLFKSEDCCFKAS